SLARLEGGTHVFTISSPTRLVHYGWLVEAAREVTFTEVGQTFTLPEPCPVLYDFWTDPQARGLGHYRNSVCHVLRELAKAGTTTTVLMCVLADNTPSRRVIEEVGFKYLGSLWHRRRFGRDTRWRTLTEGSTAVGDPPRADL